MPSPPTARPIRMLGVAIVVVFAAIGCCYVMVSASKLLLRDLLFEMEITRSLVSPHGGLVARQEVTTGGFATVWTTRIFVDQIHPAAARRPFLVYENSDSDFNPPLQWIGETLRIGLPCGRVDFMSNPIDPAFAPADSDRFDIAFVRPRCRDSTGAIFK